LRKFEHTPRDLSGWWILVFAALALALYANTLDHPFVGDDRPLIQENPTTAEPSLAGLRDLWIRPYLVGIRPDATTVSLAADHNVYRPITTLTFWLNAALSGLVPVSFRIVNVLLHALAAWVVGLLASRWRGATAGVVAGTIVLFHPIATDLINRMVGRAELLVVLGTAGFLAVQRNAQRHGWTWARTAGASVAAFVALGAKEPGIVLLPLAALQEWLGRPAPPEASDRRWWRGALALGVPLLLYASARAVAVGVPRFERSAYDLLESPLAQAPFAARLPASLSLVVDYVRMVALPWPLMALDFPARFPTWSDAEPWIGMVALAVLVGAAAWTCWRRDPYVLPLVWWLASFFVVSQLIVPAWTYREVRLAYPLLAGAALGVAWLVVGAGWSRPRARAAALASLAAYAIVCSALVVTRNADWRSDLAVAEADVRRDPDRPSAQSKLGDMLDVNGRTQEAERAYQEAARLAPTSYQVWLQLAGFYERQNRLVEARRAYERAMVVDPTFADAFVGLALLDMRAERLDEARTLLLRAEHADPDDPFAQYNLAVLDEWAGKRADAISRLRRLIERHPDHRQAVEALATLTNGASAR